MLSLEPFQLKNDRNISTRLSKVRFIFPFCSFERLLSVSFVAMEHADEKQTHTNSERSDSVDRKV